MLFMILAKNLIRIFVFWIKSVCSFRFICQIHFYEENYVELDVTDEMKESISIFDDKLYHIEKTQIQQLDTKEV